MASLELMQDQQKQRLQRFMAERLGEKSNDLNLMTASKTIKSASSHPDKWETDATLAHHVSQIEELQLENSKLKTALEKAQKELETVKVTQDKDEQQTFTGGGCGKSSVVGKVVELSRKNRSLSAELASAKNKVKQLEDKLKNLTCEEIQQSNTSLMSTANLVSCSCEHDQDTKTIAVLEDQLKEASAKSFEHRNQCEMLKQELKVALKVLGKEVGEGINVSSLLGTNSGWRGRAQQIIVLQNKVMELKQQLKQYSTSSTTAIKQPQSSGGDRQASILQKIEKKKQQALESASAQLQSLKEDHSHLEQQCSALKARNKYLTAELKQAKHQISVLCNKGKQDDLLIAMLRQKQETEFLNDTSTSTLSSSQIRHQEQLERLVHTKDAEIKELKQQIRQSSAPPGATAGRSSGNTEMHTTLNSSVLHSTLSLPETDKLNTQLHVLTVEKDKLMELVACMQDRMDEAFSTAARCQADLQIQRRKNALQEKQLMCHHGGILKSKNNENNVNDLESKLAIQKDENKVLKECLANLRQDRQKDAKMMHDLLLHSREMYLESINRITQKSSS